MTTEFKLPELGEGVASASVAQIYVSDGDEIEADQNVMELETEKAVTDLPCPHAGTVNKVHVSEGDTIEVGQTLLTIEETATEEDDGQNVQAADTEVDSEKSQAKGDASDKEVDKALTASLDEKSEEASSSENGEQRQSESDDVSTSDQNVAHEEDSGTHLADDERGEDSERDPQKPDLQRSDNGVPPPAGPATRRLARKLGVELEGVQPPHGNRIRTEDVVRLFVESGKAAALTTDSLPDFNRFGPVEREPINKITQTASRRLSIAWRAIPHVTQHGLADITKLEISRRQYLEREAEHSPKITLTSIAMKSVAGLLRTFPKFNASLDVANDELILKKHYHFGVAIDTDHGLVVPVIRDVDRKSITQLATELRDLADQARRRQLGKDDFEGGTFTVSNQGGVGGGEFTPIVNFPEVAILGLGRARPELRMIDGQPAERLMLPLSLSYDHRVINGADAARFIHRLSEILSDEFTLLVAT